MPKSRSMRRGIPSFALYGERSASTETDPLHIETIRSRSSKYLWRIGTHRHVGLSQCVYITAGQAAVDLDDAHSDLSGPSLILIPAGTVHGFGFEADTLGYVFTLELGRLTGIAGAVHRAPINALFNAPRILDLSTDTGLAARLSRLFEALLEEFQQPDSVMAPVSGWLGCSLLAVLATSVSKAAPRGVVGSPDVDRLSRFRQLIEAHYLEHWPVSRYADVLGWSESSLNRLCVNLAGGTAFEVVQQRLALEARRRLTYVAGPVAMIAAELGFKDPAYFCRFFRKHAGVSPTAFRRRSWVIDG